MGSSDYEYRTWLNPAEPKRFQWRWQIRKKGAEAPMFDMNPGEKTHIKARSAALAQIAERVLHDEGARRRDNATWWSI